MAKFKRFVRHSLRRKMAEGNEALDKCFFIVSHYNPEFVFDVEKRSTAAGAKIILWEQKKDYDSKNQLFYIDEKYERIRSALNDYCLDIKMSGKKILVLNPYMASSQTQKWDMRGGYIRNITSKDMLGVSGAASQGMEVVFSMYANEKQEWIMEHTVPQYFTLQNRSTGKYLDVCQNKTDPGTPVILWGGGFFKTKDNQLWYESAEGNICTKLNNFAIDIKEESSKAVINPVDPENPWQNWVYCNGYIEDAVNEERVLAFDDGNSTDIIICQKDPDDPGQKWTRKYV